MGRRVYRQQQPVRPRAPSTILPHRRADHNLRPGLGTTACPGLPRQGISLEESSAVGTPRCLEPIPPRRRTRLEERRRIKDRTARLRPSRLGSLQPHSAPRPTDIINPSRRIPMQRRPHLPTTPPCLLLLTPAQLFSIAVSYHRPPSAMGILCRPSSSRQERERPPRRKGGTDGMDSLPRPSWSMGSLQARACHRLRLQRDSRRCCGKQSSLLARMECRR